MESNREVNIKNRTYYFFDDMVNVKDFDSNLLKIDKKSYKNIDIYYIRYITMKDSDSVKIDSVNPLYLIIDKVDGYIEESNGNKYLYSCLYGKVKWKSNSIHNLPLNKTLKLHNLTIVVRSVFQENGKYYPQAF